MAIEKRWEAIPARLFVANGTTEGKITLQSTLDFKVKQDIILKSTTLQAVNLEVKYIESETVLYVGRKKEPIHDRFDISGFTTAGFATIEAAQQPKNDIPEKEYERAVYAEEPIVAKRQIMVDRMGRYFDTDNPFPVQLSDGSINIGTVNGELEVALSHKDNTPDAGDVHDSVRIGDGVEEAGVTPNNELQTHDQEAIDAIDQVHDLIQLESDETQTLITNLTTEVDRGQYTMNEAFNKAAAIAGQLDDVATTAATENNIAPVRITSQRALHSNLRDALGNEVSSTALNAKRGLDVAHPDLTFTGNIAGNTQAVAGFMIGYSTAKITLTGTWVGTIGFQGSDDGVNWNNIIGMLSYGTLVSSSSTNQTVIFPAGGWQQVRAVATAWTSGIANVTIGIGFGSQVNAVYQFDPNSLNATARLRSGFGDVISATARASKTGIDANIVGVTGTEDSGNSTTTPLLANGVFTGQWVKVTDFSVVAFTVFSDVASATNGLSIQWSPDGINPDRLENSDLTANVGRAFNLTKRGRYFRIVFTNGSTSQSVFRIAVDLFTSGSGIVTRPLSQTISDSNFAQLVTSVITGKNTTGQYVPHRSNSVSAIGQNSTTTNLLAGQTFTGQWEDVLGFANIAISVYSNVASATNGLVLEFSNDGVNVHDNDFYTISAANGQPTTVGVLWRYFRVRYTNGASDQSLFSLATYYSISAQKPSSHRIEDSINGQNDAELVKSVSTGRNPNDIFTNLRVQGSHDANSSSTPLAANAIFRGTWFPWQAEYIKLISDVRSDVMGTLFIDLSQDLVPTNGDDTSIHFTFPTVFDPAQSTLLRKSTPIQSRWVRHRYVNGPVAQTSFGLDAAFTVADTGASAQALSALPLLDNQATITRAVMTVSNPDKTGYQDLIVGTDGSVKTQVGSFKDDILNKALNSARAGQVVLGNTAQRLDPSPLSDRRVVDVLNHGPLNMSVGHDSGIGFMLNSILIPPLEGARFNIDPTVQLWGITENIGGTQTILSRVPTSASGTATNPNNAISSNNSYANITAAAQTITATGFTAGTTNSIVSVKLGMEAAKASGFFQTVTFQDNFTGSAGNVASVSTSGAVTGVAGHLYIASISRRSGATTVTGVSGLGLTWIQLASANNGNNTALDVWYAIGTPIGSGIVTATFSGTGTNSHINVSRYSNANPTSPIQAFATNSGNNNSPTTAGIAGTNQGIAIMAVSDRDSNMTAGVGYTLTSNQVTSAGGNSDSLGTQRKSLSSTGTETPTATLTGSPQWAAISLTIRPADAIDPVVRLSYTLSAVAGATTGNVTLSSSTDSNSTVDITGDRQWVFGDIANVNVIATGITLGTAAANVDLLYLEITDTTGITNRVSIWQGGRPVT